MGKYRPQKIPHLDTFHAVHKSHIFHLALTMVAPWRKVNSPTHLKCNSNLVCQFPFLIDLFSFCYYISIRDLLWQYKNRNEKNKNKKTKQVSALAQPEKGKLIQFCSSCWDKDAWKTIYFFERHLEKNQERPGKCYEILQISWKLFRSFILKSRFSKLHLLN